MRVPPPVIAIVLPPESFVSDSERDRYFADLELQFGYSFVERRFTHDGQCFTSYYCEQLRREDESVLEKQYAWLVKQRERTVVVAGGQRE